MSGAALSFAFFVGAVATVNPCGFALLPAYLARRLGSDDGARRSVDAVARALAVGATTTIGFLLVFGTIGTAIALGARELARLLPWAGLAIGIVLVLAGAAVLAGRRIPLRLPGVRPRRASTGLRGDLLFGVGYGTASLSCTLPVFLAATGTAVTGGVAGSALSYVAYTSGMGTVLTSLAIAATLSRQGLARSLGRLLPYVSRASGALLLLAGAYVVYYWTFFLLPGGASRSSGRALIDRGGEISGRFSTWLGSSTGHTVEAALLAAIGLLAVWALWRLVISARSGTRAPATAAASQQIVDEGSTHETASSNA